MYWSLFFGTAFDQSPLGVDGRSGVDMPPCYLLCSSSGILLAYYFAILSLPLASTVLHCWRRSRGIGNGRLRRSFDHGFIFARCDWLLGRWCRYLRR